MQPVRWPNDENVQQLLADRATEGLDADAQAQLEALIATSDDFDVDAYDVAAAVVELALMPGAGETMPEALRRSLEADADRFAGEPSQPMSIAPDAPPAPTQTQPRVDVIGRLGRLGWLAAAAGIAIAVFVSLPPAEPTVDERRAQLLATADGVMQLPWKALETERFGGIKGDVVWSTDRQEGYMRIAGIPANNPTEQQYQLWIVDPTRDTEPIDGGVFDVPASGEVVIPIDPKLRAGAPVAFALTLEKPGGVVEHDPADGPLLVIASVE